MTDLERAELDRCFDHHKPDFADAAKYEALTAKAKELAALFYELCPPSADRSAAIRLLREARMTANASIACKG